MASRGVDKKPLTKIPLTVVVLVDCSLNKNALCGLGKNGNRTYTTDTYTTEGIIKIADALKINTSITSIRQAGAILNNCRSVNTH